MKNLRVIDQNGNNTDYEAEFVPRVGERLTFAYSINKGPFERHFFRVKDVEYSQGATGALQAAILIEEESDPVMWPD